MAEKLWSDEEIRVMLNLIRDQKVANRLNVSKCKTRVFNNLSTGMKNSGYTRSLKQIRNKLKSLKRSYFRSKNSIWISPSQRGTCRHYKELDELFGNSLAETSSSDCNPIRKEENFSVDSGNCAIQRSDNDSENATVVPMTQVLNYEDGKSTISDFSKIIQQLQMQFCDFLEKERDSYKHILQQMLERQERITQDREKKMASVIVGILSLCEENLT